MKTRASALVASLAFSAFMVSGGVAASAPGQWDLPPDDSAVIKQAMADVQGCLSQPGSTLAVFYLIDTSGSMDGNDRQGLRYAAIEASITPLAELTGRESADPHPVQVAAGTFSNDFSPVKLRGANADGWLEVTEDSAPLVAQELSTAIEDVPTEGTTNWLKAIDGASKSLKRQEESASGRANCQMLVWLTDGGIQLSNPEDTREDGEAIKDLCGVAPDEDSEARPEGLMFQLRDRGVVVLGLLLATDASVEETSKISYFRPIVQGAGQVNPDKFAPGAGPRTFSCGALVDGSQGAQLLTRNASQLATTFSDMVYCFVSRCTLPPPPDASPPFWELWVPTGVSEIVITTAKDTVVMAEDEEWCTSSAQCSSEIRGDLVTITVKQFGNHSGKMWTLKPPSFDPASPPSYFYFIDLEMRPDGPLDVESGNAAAFAFSAVRADGSAAQLDSSYLEAGLTGRASVPGSDDVNLTFFRNGDTWTLDPSSPFLPSQSGTITTLLEVTSAGPPGKDPIRFEAVQDSFNFNVTLPPGLPTVTAPADGLEAVFTTLEGPRGTASTKVVVTGNPENDGLVCFEEPVVTSDPSSERVDSYTWTWSPSLDARGCAPVAANQVSTFEITVSNPKQFAATVRGYLPIGLAAAEAPMTRYPSNRDFALPTATVKNTTVLWGVVVGLLLFGILVPYVLLLILARRQARFSKDFDGSRWAALPVVLGPGGVPRVGEIAPIDYKIIFFEGGGAQRSIDVGVTRHEIQPPRVWPFRQPAITVTVPVDSLVFSNQEGVPSRPSNSGLSSLQISRVFCFVTPVPRPESTAPGDLSGWNSDEVEVSAPREDQFAGQVFTIVAGYDLQAAVSRTYSEIVNWAQWGEIYGALEQIERENDRRTPAPPDNDADWPSGGTVTSESTRKQGPDAEATDNYW